jgi:hypothetical protein
MIPNNQRPGSIQVGVRCRTDITKHPKENPKPHKPQMKLSTSRIFRAPVVLAVVLVSAFAFALPAEARDRHDHDHHHGKKAKKHRHHSHRHHHHIPVRFCGSHRHHHTHYFHGWDHRTYKCYGHR